MFKTKKRKYFDGMLADAEKIIYDLEFKKFAALEERESVRQRYDKTQDALNNIKNKEKVAKLDEKDIADREAIQKATETLKREMDAIEGTIIGAPPSELLPDGAEGIDIKLGNWVRRRECIKRFIQRFC